MPCLSFASDLWALGCVMYQCLAGHPPFPVSSPSALLSPQPAPPLPPSCPASSPLHDLLARLLCKDPRGRISWAELREHSFWRAPLSSRPLPASGMPWGQAGGEGRLQRPVAAATHVPGDERRPERVKTEEEKAQAEACGQEEMVQVAEREERGWQGGRRQAEDEAPSHPPDCTESSRKTTAGEAGSTGEEPPRLGSKENAFCQVQATLPFRAEDSNAGDIHLVGTGGRSSNQRKGMKTEDSTEITEGGSTAGGELAEGPPAEIPASSGSRREGHGLRLSLAGASSTSAASLLTNSTDIELDLCSGAAALPAPAGTRGATLEEEGRPAEPQPTEHEGGHSDVAAGGRKRGDGTSTSGKVGKTGQLESMAVQGLPEVDVPCSKGPAESLAVARRFPVDVEGLAAAEPLLWCAAEEEAVQPILQNRRIERLAAPSFDRQLLPVPALTSDQVAAMATTRAEASHGPSAHSVLAGQQAEGSAGAAGTMPAEAELSRYLARLLAVLSGPAAMAEKVAVLRYLQALVFDSEDAATALLRCPSLLPALLRCLRSGRVATLRCETAAVLGLLLRRCEAEGALAQPGLAAALASTLSECLREREVGQMGDRLRRRAVAALGELLFLCGTLNPEAHMVLSDSERVGETGKGASVATPGKRTAHGLAKEDKPAAETTGIRSQGSKWALPADSLGALLQVLRRSDDEVAVHYAAKSLENLCALGASWIDQLLRTAPDALQLLTRLALPQDSLELLHKGKPTSGSPWSKPAPPLFPSPLACGSPLPQGLAACQARASLRATACACLVRIIRHRPELCPFLLAHCKGLPGLLAPLLAASDSHSTGPADLTAPLNLLNHCLLAAAQQEANDLLDAGDCSALWPLLLPVLREQWEGPQELLQGKALVTAALLLCWNGQAVMPALCSSSRFLGTVEMMRKEAWSSAQSYRLHDSRLLPLAAPTAPFLAGCLTLLEGCIVRAAHALLEHAAIDISNYVADVSSAATHAEDLATGPLPTPGHQQVQAQVPQPLQLRGQHVLRECQQTSEVLLQLLASPMMRPVVFTATLLQRIGNSLALLSTCHRHNRHLAKVRDKARTAGSILWWQR